MRRPRRDDGSALVMALAFLALFGVIAAALAGFAVTSFRSADVLEVRGEDLYTADGRVDQAIARLRATPDDDCLEPVENSSSFFVDSAGEDPILVKCVSEGESEEALPGGDHSMVLLSDETNRTDLSPYAPAGPNPVPTLEKWGTGGVQLQGKVKLNVGDYTSVYPAVCFRPGVHGVVEFCNDPAAIGQVGPVKIVKDGDLSARVTSLPNCPPPPPPYYSQHLLFPDGGSWVCPAGTTVTDPGGGGAVWRDPSTEVSLPTDPARDYVKCEDKAEWVWLGWFSFAQVQGNCIRQFRPGRYTPAVLRAASRGFYRPPSANEVAADPFGIVADAPQPGGGTKRVRVRANWFAPWAPGAENSTPSGVYYFEDDLFFVESLLEPVVVMGGSDALWDPVSQPISARCQGDAGVQLVFAAGQGLMPGFWRYAFPASGPTQLTACYIRSDQLPVVAGDVVGQAGVVLYQRPYDPTYWNTVPAQIADPPQGLDRRPPLEDWAYLNDMSAQVHLNGVVYAPQGRIQANLPASGESVFARGIVAWSLRVAGDGNATLVGQRNLELVTTVRITVRICDDEYAPGQGGAEPLCESTKPDATARVKVSKFSETLQMLLSEWDPG